MIGGKRRSVSYSSTSDDSPFHKRATLESPFGTQGTAPAEVEVVGTPSLDRRKAARLHVRALNTEFASWVQSQLQDHPDELWEDGVRDYLTHASDILEKFTDVVNWLKTKRVSEGSVSTLITDNAEEENGLEAMSQEKSVPEKSMFGMLNHNAGQGSSSNTGASTSSTSVLGTSAGSAPWGFGLSASSQALSQSSSSGLATSWNSAVFNGNSVSPVKTFSTSSSPASGTSSNSKTTSLMTTSTFMTSTSSGLFSTSVSPSLGATPSFTTAWSTGAFANSKPVFSFGDNEPEQPSSPSLKNSEEKGVVVVHETKCKLYLKSTDTGKGPWKEKGPGQLFIKCDEAAGKGTKESKPRILIRNDVGRIMLNASLYPGIKTSLQKNALVAIFHTLDENSGEAVAHTFLIRLKTEEERNKLADAIREHAPAV